MPFPCRQWNANPSKSETSAFRMTFSFQCSVCNKTLRATSRHIGRVSKCPGCGESVTVPDPGQHEDHPPIDPLIDDVKQRLDELENRVARLEEQRIPVLEVDDQAAQPDSDESRSIIHARIRNKRFQPQNLDLGQYQDFVWFDCSYSPQKLTKPTRAIKGILEFTDLFGEVKFQIGVTLNERLEPNRLFNQTGTGFEYNKFLDAHQWVLATDEADMKVQFKVTQILFEDKTTKSFA